MVVLWSDGLIFLLTALLVLGICWAWRQPHLKAPLQKLLSNRMGLVALMVLVCFYAIGFLDSLHYRSAVPDAATGYTSARIQSVLDRLLSPLNSHYEATYAAPFAQQSYSKTSVQLPDGRVSRQYAALTYLPGATEPKWLARLFIGTGYSSGLVALLIGVWALWRWRKESSRSLKPIPAAPFPWPTFWVTLWLLLTVTMVLWELAMGYHVAGTDKVGQDVFYQAIKSVRTGLIIGLVTLGAMLPFAVIMGLSAGYFKGRVDDVVQYIYTTLSSIPSVLLIAAAVLALQVYMASHSAWFGSLEQRADTRLLALCFILGLTSWTSLCRVLRAETLKLSEMDYVKAARGLGVGHGRILLRHILPNVMPIILIVSVLDFSSLVLAEAVLSYVGVGVDPTTFSWGNMINAARLELAREPIVWWPLLAAFSFMFILVLAANLFADAVREAFDPRAGTMVKRG